MRSATSGLCTTAMPSAASVGARMQATIASQAIGTSGNRAMPTSRPAPMVSGSPIASKRAGSVQPCRSVFVATPLESENRITASAISPMAVITSLSSGNAIQPAPSGPAASPRPTHSIGAVTTPVSRRLDTAPNTRNNSAVSARMTC